MNLFISYSYSTYNPEYDVWRTPGFSNTVMTGAPVPKCSKDIKHLEDIIRNQCFEDQKVNISIINFISLAE